MFFSNRSQKQIKKLITITWLFSTLIFSVVGPVGDAFAQIGAPEPPPPGDGSVAPPVNPGDLGGPQPVPSGTADNTAGTNFSVGAGSDRTVVRLFNNGPRGQRMVQTIRPDTLTPDQLNQIQGILGVNLGSGEQSVDVFVTDGQLEQLNEAMAAYPQTTNNGGRKQITTDAPAANRPLPGREALYAFPGVVPTVATFSRYLVITGVVMATVFMALAAYSMVNGSPYGGARVLGAASGLFLLLAAYTIWKIVQMNTFNGNSDRAAQIQAKAGGALVQDAFLTRPNMPATPAVGATSIGRSGVPVQPLDPTGQ
ncbi:MAG: hypothetical protein K2Y32_13700 [Candidatus Obscuribacterales bacterium]|nr:hypothetical protein [Candidatus Obscuribacterales bacterium]